MGAHPLPFANSVVSEERMQMIVVVTRLNEKHVKQQLLSFQPGGSSLFCRVCEVD